MTAATVTAVTTVTTVTTRVPAPAMTVAGGRALRASVAAVVVVLPFGDVEVPGPGLRLVHVAMLVCALVLAHQVALRGVRLPASVVLAGCGLGLLSGIVSGALGVDPSRSVPLVITSVLTACYAVAVALACTGLPRDRVLDGLDLLVVVGGVVAAMALVSAGTLQAAEGGSVVNGRLTGPFAQPNELGIFCASLLPVALACIVTSRSRQRAATLGVATVALAVACVLSMSRGAWIGAAAAFVCLAVCEPAVRRPLRAVGLTALTACAAALASPVGTPVLGVLGARLRSLREPSQNQYDDRPLVWAEAWRQAGEHPWLGVGPGAFRTAATESSSAVAAQPPEHPHNLLLTVLADRGVIGAAVGMVLLAGCVLAVRRHVLAGHDPGPAAATVRIRSIAVVAGLTAVAVHGGFDMPLRNPIVGGLVWTLIGMAVVAETVPLARHRTHPLLSARAGARHPMTSPSASVPGAATNPRKQVPVPC